MECPGGDDNPYQKVSQTAISTHQLMVTCTYSVGYWVYHKLFVVWTIIHSATFWPLSKQYTVSIYYIDTSVLLENRLLIKFIWTYIQDSSGIFSISSLVRISILSLVSSLSLKLYLNSLVYNQNIFRSSSKVFGNPRQSSAIFRNFRKMFGNVRETFRQILENLRKSSEVVGNLWKVVTYAVICMSIQ